MLHLAGKVAVVTGAASGVGRALCQTFLNEGMQVVMADISQKALLETQKEFAKEGFKNTLAVTVDVTDEDSVEHLAVKAYQTFGKVHILCNNAGVGISESKRKIWQLPQNDWQWGFAVNTMGAVNGIRSFVPRMLEGDEWGHVVNTSSANGGLTSLATTPIYASSKAALTSLTEVLHYQLLKEKSKIKASLLFPGPHLVNTGILNSSLAKPEKYRSEGEKDQSHKSMKELAKSSGVPFKLTEPSEVAELTLEAILAGKFWILPESERGDQKFKKRTQSILSRENPVYPE